MTRETKLSNRNPFHMCNKYITIIKLYFTVYNYNKNYYYYCCCSIQLNNALLQLLRIIIIILNSKKPFRNYTG